MNIQAFIHVILLLPDKFSSHQFIEKYMQEFEADYISGLHPENGGFRNMHSTIGNFLMKHSNRLNIEKIGNSIDKNIKGYDSQNALWRKNGTRQSNNIIATTILLLLYVFIMPYGLYGEPQHQRYNPNEKNIIVSETIIDTIEANRIFKEKYEPFLLRRYEKGVEKKEKINRLCLNSPSKVKTLEEKQLLEQAYLAYSKTHSSYKKGGSDFYIPLPILMSIPIHTREKRYTQDGIELTDRNIKKGKITSEVKAYLKYYNTFLEDSLIDERSRIRLGWQEWLKKEDIPYKEIQVSKTNPNYRGLHYNNIENLDTLDYNEQNVGWEFLDNSKGMYHEDSYPQQVKYYVFNEIPNYKVLEGDSKIKYVYDNNGNLNYVQKLMRQTNYKEFEEIKRLVYLKDYKNNKYNIKSQPRETLQFLEKTLSTPNEVTNLKYKKQKFLLESAIVMDSYFKAAGYLGPILSKPYSKMLASSDKMKRMKKDAKGIDGIGLRYIEQLEKDHENDFGYVYIIDRISNTSFRVVYLNAQTLIPSYCAEISYSTGQKPYTTSYSTRLISMPSDIPPVIP